MLVGEKRELELATLGDISNLIMLRVNKPRTAKSAPRVRHENIESGEQKMGTHFSLILQQFLASSPSKLKKNNLGGNFQEKGNNTKAPGAIRSFDLWIPGRAHRHTSKCKNASNEGFEPGLS